MLVRAPRIELFSAPSERTDGNLLSWRRFDITRPFGFRREAGNNLPRSAQFSVGSTVLINKCPLIFVENRHPFLPRNPAIGFVRERNDERRIPGFPVEYGVASSVLSPVDDLFMFDSNSNHAPHSARYVPTYRRERKAPALRRFQRFRVVRAAVLLRNLQCQLPRRTLNARPALALSGLWRGLHPCGVS